GTFGILRRAIAFGAGRPLWGLVHLVAVAAVLVGYWFFPGLAVVFGVALPMATSFAVVWHSGVLPVPDGAHAPLRRREPTEV
ncbi:MAG: hypothetical protein INR66_24605, partial [Gordonia polyisoprenivorans]|nr:hypothetical protein [Gordonia polyisoprenivorans]